MELANYLAKRVCEQYREKLGKSNFGSGVFECDSNNPRGEFSFKKGVIIRFVEEGELVKIALEGGYLDVVLDYLENNLKKSYNGLYEVANYPIVNGEDVLEHIRPIEGNGFFIEAKLKKRGALSEDDYNAKVLDALHSSILFPIFSALSKLPSKDFMA
ncbi:MAG: hypothetical protein Q8L29_03320 [archaeon]|nr:hypothetical protein [archaeon]